MANNQNKVSYIVIGLGIYKLDEDIDAIDLDKITKKVQAKIREDRNIDHTITMDRLITIIKPVYDTYMNEKEINKKKYEEFKEKVKEASKKDLQHFLSQQNYKYRPVQSNYNPIFKEDTALGGTRRRTRGRRGRSRRRRSRRPYVFP